MIGAISLFNISKMAVSPKQKPKQKRKKISISFSVKEVEVLNRYAADMGSSRAVALRRIVKSHLADYLRNALNAAPDNQLDIFDSVQIDIFNNTEKTL